MDERRQARWTPDDVEQEPWIDDLPDGDWDEPTADEDDVLGVEAAKYLPLLMQKKYGDDWELLLGDDEDLSWRTAVAQATEQERSTSTRCTATTATRTRPTRSSCVP